MAKETFKVWLHQSAVCLAQVVLVQALEEHGERNATAEHNLLRKPLINNFTIDVGSSSVEPDSTNEEPCTPTENQGPSEGPLGSPLTNEFPGANPNFPLGVLSHAPCFR